MSVTTKALPTTTRLLNYDESLLIFNNVTSTLGFIRAIERGIAGRGRSIAPPTKDEIPF